MPARPPGENHRPPSLEPPLALETMRWLVNNARRSTANYSCVIVDCGADSGHLVSAPFVLCDYGFIVRRDQAAHVPMIERGAQFHRDSFPDMNIRAMNVIVNMDQNPELARPGYLPDDPAVRRASGGEYDFEGVGLNDYFLAVTKVLGKQFTEDPHLIPDESKVWIKPYVQAMQTFPENVLRLLKFRFLTLFTAALVAFGVSVVGLCAWNLYHLNQASAEIVTTRTIGKSGIESESEAKRNMDRLVIPVELSRKVTVDRERRELVLKGVLAKDEVNALKAAIEYEPWRDAVIEGAVLAQSKALETAARNEHLRSWLFISATVAFVMMAARIWQHVVLSRRKRFLEEILKVREANDEREMEARITEFLREDKEAKPHLAWLRDEFRRHVPVRRAR